MNVLVLNPKTVCVEACETAQMEQFDKLGFEVIPVPFWDVAPFGGGLHCATADVYREGTCEDYFPKQLVFNLYGEFACNLGERIDKRHQVNPPHLALGEGMVY